MDIAKVCRLCGKNTGKKMFNIFAKNEKGQQLLQLIKQYIPILVYRTDPLSKNLCEECYMHLDMHCHFLKQCVTVQDFFKNELFPLSDSCNIQLYLNALDNHQSDFLVTLPPYCRKPEMKNVYCQVSKIEIDEQTEIPLQKKRKNNVTILTPEIINEINVESQFHLRAITETSITDTSEIVNSEFNIESQYLVTAITDDGAPVKKRRLAGPKSKTRRQSLQNPPSLLQCALHKINENLHHSIDDSNNLDYSKNYNSWESGQTFNQALGLYDSSDSNTDSNGYSFDPNTPVVCNYCMKAFTNSVDLSKHEINHMLVDIGPRIENKQYAFKCRSFYSLYLNWRKRMSAEKVKSPILRHQLQMPNENEDNFDTEQELDPSETSLLIPDSANTEKVFEVIDNEITVNGVPLKNYDKAERRTLFKSIVVDGVKRKFCPVCRHTFKDNWAIDIHYLNSSCQYTCKYCGLKFKYHQDLFAAHLKMHEGEPCNKIFGPADRRTKYKRRRVMKLNRFGALGSSNTLVSPKVKPLKMKHLLQKKSATKLVKIKTEPGTTSSREAVNLEKAANIQPYQAYFCRKCFKVFFKIDEFNTHTSNCKGTCSSENDQEVKPIPSEQSKSPEMETNSITSKRPVRSCVKDLSILNDSDSESIPGSWSPQVTQENENLKTSSTGGFECGVCCSSFPSRHSRNSHMRIHKGQKIPADKLTNYLSTKSATTTPKSEPSNQMKLKDTTVKDGNIRLANLNPTVARLVQNNPHLTIRSYTKPNVQENSPEIPQPAESDSSSSSEQLIKRAYRCSDCNGRFENKSLLYYHKLQSCIVKRHYECAFCKKKFGGQEQYNTHMLYVHPE